MTASLPVAHEYQYVAEPTEDHSIDSSRVKRIITESDDPFHLRSTGWCVGRPQPLFEEVQLTPWSEVPEEALARLTAIDKDIVSLQKQNDKDSKLCNKRRHQRGILLEQLRSFEKSSDAAVNSTKTLSDKEASAWRCAVQKADEWIMTLNNWYYIKKGGPAHATREETEHFMKNKQILNCVKTEYLRGLQRCKDQCDAKVAEYTAYRYGPECLEASRAYSKSIHDVVELVMTIRARRLTILSLQEQKKNLDVKFHDDDLCAPDDEYEICPPKHNYWPMCYTSWT